LTIWEFKINVIRRVGEVTVSYFKNKFEKEDFLDFKINIGYHGEFDPGSG
tara:strand:+ start:4178 stop:4327 length:150 start_codon:yes stop_codon:yes gene_type:complete